MNAAVGTLLKGEAAATGMLGSLVSSMSQRLVRMSTMALMVSGAGVAGYSIYLDQYAPEGSQAGSFVAFFKDNARFFLILGAVGVVVGALLNFVMMRRMQKRMMGGMGMAGPGGMPDMGRLMAMQGMAAPAVAAPPVPVELVKVRCRSCSALEAEGASFCSKCGKPMA
jgi:hypothetical protein